ncbi:unnamed protein product, partial [marine sediment metagenome]
LSSVLLQRASQRALDRIHGIIAESKEEPHKKYLRLWHVLRTDDNQIAYMFDDMKRSNAYLKLLAMVNNNLLTSDEINAFTKETREKLKTIADANKAL